MEENCCAPVSVPMEPGSAGGCLCVLVQNREPLSGFSSIPLDLGSLGLIHTGRVVGGSEMDAASF